MWGSPSIWPMLSELPSVWYSALIVSRRADLQQERNGMMRELVLLAALACAMAGAARAEGLDMIELRQAGQDLLSGDFAGIRAVVAAKGDVKPLEDPAKAIARWMRQFPLLFPKGTEEGHHTRALPAIWSNPAGFQKAAGDLVDAASKLADLAKTGEADAVAAQVKVVGDACAACHRTYRAR
jgi:cytochrome c556